MMLAPRRGVRVLHLLDGPVLTVDGRRAPLPDGGARLVAFVALHPRGVDRRHAAGTLWPSCGDERAGANLRSTLWRLTHEAQPVVEAAGRHLELAADVQVDVRQLETWARHAAEATVPAWLGPSIDLLPCHNETWIVLHRERIRQRVLHAVESRSRDLLGQGRVEESLALARQALRWDPVRESAVRASCSSIDAETGE